MNNLFRIFDKTIKEFREFTLSDWDRVDTSSGVKDKDGEYIFEGDYLYLDNFDTVQDPYSKDFINVDEVRLVKFSNGKFEAVSLFDESLSIDLSSLNENEMKIVGNIRTQVFTPDLIGEL